MCFTVKYIERDNQTGLWLQDELFSIRRRSMASFIEMKRSQHFKLHHVNGKKISSLVNEKSSVAYSESAETHFPICLRVQSPNQ